MRTYLLARRQADGGLDHATLIELQAALLGGAGAAEAVAATCAGGALDDAARQAHLGRPLAEIAAGSATTDPAAGFLLRCLALTERAGGGGAEAVAFALSAVRDDTALQRLIAIRTQQARGTAVVLAAIPVAAWVLLVALDERMLALYATPLGWLTGGTAVALALTAWRWMRRLTASVQREALAVDPLAPAAPPMRYRRGLIAAAAAGSVAAAVAGPGVGLLAAAAAGFGLARPARARHPDGGSTSETVALLAVALETGLPVATAFAEVARVAPTAAAPVLHAAARRTSGGWTVRDALADTPLAVVGSTIAAAERWGAPAAPALRALADDLREQRRTAAELAAERLQLALIFPTTLLTLPAFVLGIVPPLLWSTVRG